MKIKTPDHFMGEPIPDDAIEIALAEAEKGNEEKETQGKAQGEAPPLEGFIYVPSVDLYFAKERSHLGKGWHDTHRTLHKQNLRMPTIPEFVEFLGYLGADPTDENTSIYDEITEIRSPLRRVWLDAKFHRKDNQLWVAYNHRVDVNLNLVAQDHEKLEGHLMQNKIPGISIEHWLNNPTKQGLPQENVGQGDLWYWHPKAGGIASFNVYVFDATLDCNEDPGDSTSWSVFACAENAGGKQ